jgi:molybdopterin synthase sulfur carrier subunit
MQIHVRYFAAAREARGRETEQVQCEEGETVGDLFARLRRAHPALEGAAASLRFALDERFVAPETPLRPGGVLALIPPVGGG